GGLTQPVAAKLASGRTSNRAINRGRIMISSVILYRLRTAGRLRRGGFGKVTGEAVPLIGQRVDDALAQQSRREIDLPAGGGRGDGRRRGGDLLPVARVSRGGGELGLSAGGRDLHFDQHVGAQRRADVAERGGASGLEIAQLLSGKALTDGAGRDGGDLSAAGDRL